jgi:hypothetical protein
VEAYRNRRRLASFLDGTARNEDGELVVALPARTVEFRGELVLYRTEYTYDEAALSTAERRDRPFDTLVDEYAALAETYVSGAPQLIDGEPRTVGPSVYGILDWRRGSLASYFELPDHVADEVVQVLEDRRR